MTSPQPAPSWRARRTASGDVRAAKGPSAAARGAGSGGTFRGRLAARGTARASSGSRPRLCKARSMVCLGLPPRGRRLARPLSRPRGGGRCRQIPRRPPGAEEGGAGHTPVRVALGLASPDRVVWSARCWCCVFFAWENRTDGGSTTAAKTQTRPACGGGECDCWKQGFIRNTLALGSRALKVARGLSRF